MRWRRYAACATRYPSHTLKCRKHFEALFVGTLHLRIWTGRGPAVSIPTARAIAAGACLSGNRGPANSVSGVFPRPRENPLSTDTRVDRHEPRTIATHPTRAGRQASAPCRLCIRVFPRPRGNPPRHEHGYRPTRVAHNRTATDSS